MSATDRPTYRVETLTASEPPDAPILVYMSVAAWAECLRLRIRSMTPKEGRAAMLDRAARN